MYLAIKNSLIIFTYLCLSEAVKFLLLIIAIDNFVVFLEKSYVEMYFISNQKYFAVCTFDSTIYLNLICSFTVVFAIDPVHFIEITISLSSFVTCDKDASFNTVGTFQHVLS